MSRNGAGVYSKVNTFVAGETITATGHNQNWDDIADEMTNSVAADGQTSMTGPLNAAAGTAAAPSLTFAADTDSGIYRIGANNVGVAAGGTKIVDVSTTAVAVTGDLSASGTVKQAGFALMPIGTVLLYAGSSLPSGWLECAGQNVSRTTYAALFTALGTTHGSGDGSTTFGIPDCRGRVAAGKEGSLTNLTANGWTGNSTILGSKGGEDAHFLTLGELPTGINSSASNSISVTSTVSNIVQDSITSSPNSGGTLKQLSASATSGAVTSTGSNSISVSSTNTTGNSHKNVQPTIILYYIIFAGV